MFSQSRVNQELGREGILPFSKLWVSNLPFNAPLAALGLRKSPRKEKQMHLIFNNNRLDNMRHRHFHRTPRRRLQFCHQRRMSSQVSLLTIQALDPSISLPQITYPFSVINAPIPLGIIYLSLFDPYPNSGWSRLGVRTKLAAAFFGFANTFLFLVPLFKPPSGSEPYAALPYWTHAAGGWTVFASGFLYWLIWAKILPWKGRYELYQVKDVGGDGLVRNAFRRLPK